MPFPEEHLCLVFYSLSEESLLSTPGSATRSTLPFIGVLTVCAATILARVVINHHASAVARLADARSVAGFASLLDLTS